MEGKEVGSLRVRVEREERNRVREAGKQKLKRNRGQGRGKKKAEKGQRKTKKKEWESKQTRRNETIKTGEYKLANVNTHVHSNAYVPLYTPFLCTTFLRSPKPNT